MNIFLIVIAVCFGFYFFDKVCLWLESKGWLYYRNKKAECGIIGRALLEFHSFLNPSTKHVIEVKQNSIKQKCSEADVPGELKK